MKKGNRHGKTIFIHILVIISLMVSIGCADKQAEKGQPNGQVLASEMKNTEVRTNVIQEEKKINASTTKEFKNMGEESGKSLANSAEVDRGYRPRKVKIDESERELVESVVMGETSGVDVYSAALVAQAIRDSMITDQLTAREVVINFQYTSNLKQPNDNVKEAVRLIFDEGKWAVQHRVMYFYAPSVSRSKWHESQKFVVEYGGHRVFDRKE